MEVRAFVLFVRFSSAFFTAGAVFVDSAFLGAWFTAFCSAGLLFSPFGAECWLSVLEVSGSADFVGIALGGVFISAPEASCWLPDFVGVPRPSSGPFMSGRICCSVFTSGSFCSSFSSSFSSSGSVSASNTGMPSSRNDGSTAFIVRYESTTSNRAWRPSAMTAEMSFRFLFDSVDSIILLELGQKCFQGKLYCRIGLQVRQRLQEQTLEDGWRAPF